MTAAQLLNDLALAGVSIEAYGDRLRYSPRSAMTAGLMDRVKAHRDELLEMLGKTHKRQVVEVANVEEVWAAVLDRIGSDPLFPDDCMEALRSADIRWVSDAQDCADEPRAGQAKG